MSVCLTGWTPRTEREIAREALELGPPDLRRVVRIYDEEFRNGMRDAIREERGRRSGDHYAIDGDQLAERILAEANAAIAIIEERDALSLFAYRLGVIAHLVGDANNPFHTSDAPRLDSYRGDYESYTERKLEKFPLVFYGIEKPMRAEFTISRAIERSRDFGSALQNEYERGNRIRSSSEFDDRSTAFGVASISWSRSVSDLTNIYYYIWSEAGGDVRRASRLSQGVVREGGR